MLKNKITLFSVLVVAIGISVAAFFVAFKGEAQTQQNDNKLEAKVLRKGNSKDTQLTKKELDDAATPIVDYDMLNANLTDSNRLNKNARYDKQSIVKRDVGSKAVEFLMYSGDLQALPDLPINQSDLVIEGKVTDSTAHLSNDKGGVYSEFIIKVTDVLKTSPDLTVNSKDSIVTERFGGRVRYPGGKIFRYGIAGQGSPMKGGKYLFFLTKTEQDDYKILTAYELRGNKVFALDGSRVTLHGKGEWSFDKHENQDYQDFKAEVEKAKKNPQNSSQIRRVSS